MLFPHVLQTVKVWVRLIVNYGHFTWRTVRLFGGILYSLWEIFVKSYTLHLTPVRYTR